MTSNSKISTDTETAAFLEQCFCSQSFERFKVTFRVCSTDTEPCALCTSEAEDYQINQQLTRAGVQTLHRVRQK